MSRMQFVVAPGGELPIYRQLMRQITDAIAGGRLRPGDKLSSQRELAEQLVISPLTVKKAYDELEREGLIRSERGRGTFVNAGASKVSAPEQLERLREAARGLLSRAHLGGVPYADLLSLLEELHAELESERAGSGGPDSE